MTRFIAIIAVAACHTPAPDLAIHGDPGDQASTPAFQQLLEPPSPLPERVGARSGSPVVLARIGERTVAYIADEDGKQLRLVDVDAQDALATLALPGRPAQVIVLADHRLAVTLRDRDELVVVTGSGLPDHPFRIAQTVALPSEPIGLATTPDDTALLVTSGWAHALTRLATTAELAITGSWQLAAEPRGVVAADDNLHAYVSHAVGQAVERVDLTAAVPAQISVAGIEQRIGRHSTIFETPRQACQGFTLVKAVAPAGRIFVPEVEVETGGPQRSSGYGSSEGMAPEVFGVAVVDEAAGTLLPESVALREPRTISCVLPRGAATSAAGSLFVTCIGSNLVVELAAASVSPADAQLRHWDVADGPTGIAIDDAHARAVVWSQYAQTLTTLPIEPDAPALAHTLVLDHDALPAIEARGRELFTAVTDPRISITGQACASCHPDGRQDTLVWSSPNGPRQTPMLAGRLADTAPYGWNGNAKQLAQHARSTFERLRGFGLKGPDLDALLAYITSLRVPSPAPTDDTLAVEGEAIFARADTGCARCHGDDGRSPDGKRHDIASGDASDDDQDVGRSEFDTPSLAFVGGTAPYYHDGRYATLRELLVSTKGDMGQQRALSEHELTALEAYLRTL